MKKLDLGQMIAILANVGVILGIVFLAFELRQNNDLLGVQVRSIQIDQQLANPNLILENPLLASILWKIEQNEALTGEEELMMTAMALRVMRQIEYVFNDSQARGVAVPAQAIEVYRSQFRGEAVFRWPLANYWPEMRGYFDSEFVEWFENQVIVD